MAPGCYGTEVAALQKGTRKLSKRFHRLFLRIYSQTFTVAEGDKETRKEAPCFFALFCRGWRIAENRNKESE